MIGAFIFIFGLILGSFLHVVCVRISKGAQFLKGRSFCVSCGNQIAWHDNIPLLSYIFLQGKCRKCNAGISWTYPFSEFISGFVLLGIYLKFGLGFIFLFYSLVSVFLILIFIYDLKYSVIPDEFSVPAIVISFLGSVFILGQFWAALIGIIIGVMFFLSQYIFSKGRWVGDGDIRIGALMGALLGWKLLFVGLFSAYILGSIIGLFLLAKKEKKMTSQIPFGPFLVIGTYIAIFFGREIVIWYFNVLL